MPIVESKFMQRFYVGLQTLSCHSTHSAFNYCTVNRFYTKYLLYLQSVSPDRD